MVYQIKILWRLQKKKKLILTLFFPFLLPYIFVPLCRKHSKEYRKFLRLLFLPFSLKPSTPLDTLSSLHFQDFTVFWSPAPRRCLHSLLCWFLFSLSSWCSSAPKLSPWSCFFCIYPLMILGDSQFIQLIFLVLGKSHDLLSKHGETPF